MVRRSTGLALSAALPAPTSLPTRRRATPQGVCLHVAGCKSYWQLVPLVHSRKPARGQGCRHACFVVLFIHATVAYMSRYLSIHDATPSLFGARLCAPLRVPKDRQQTRPFEIAVADTPDIKSVTRLSGDSWCKMLKNTHSARRRSRFPRQVEQRRQRENPAEPRPHPPHSRQNPSGRAPRPWH